ncbi:CDP-alcohol phosphatidyltransferase family protein [Roseomonas sp. CCTCC AB2023176]|uniref:CDP-alcohol phosphatidyltransferase family protein n=1 Tax=Roseomonas sp. CCTCC AB2023176 TaxID=3342640 RepID=UPI0035DAD02D
MSADTIVHRVVRPFVRAIAPTGVTPNQITTARLIHGIAAAVCFALPSPTWQAAGAAIFLLAYFLDRCDGELARQTGQSSPWGHRYDLLSDGFCVALAFICVGIGQTPALGTLGPVLGALAGLGVGVLFWQLNVLNLGSLQGWRLSKDVLVDSDDLLIFVPILVWLGATVPMLWAAAIITPAGAIILALQGARRERARG